MKIDALMRMVPKGKVFSVTFEKKDGTIRKMTCRTGVTKGVNGKGMKYNPKEKGLMTVFDMNKRDFRMINADTIQSMTIQGTTFNVTR